MAWGPEQISHRLRVDFPDDESMRISHEAIYQALFIEGRGALKRELVMCPRTGRALRVPRARSRNKPQGHVTAEVVLSERPAEAADRAVPGYWEGNLIIGTGRSMIGTLVERGSRSTLLVHLPRLEGRGENPPVKNGPSLGGYGAIAMNAALIVAMTQLPGQLRKTLTRDRGKEFSGHAQSALDTGAKVFFADPYSPWQRPTNENTNGLLRQYFPKGTDLSRWSSTDLEAVATAINNRPRKILGWRTPAEVFEERLRSLQQPGGANGRLNSLNIRVGPSLESAGQPGSGRAWARSGPVPTTPRPSPSTPASKERPSKVKRAGRASARRDSTPSAG